MSINTWSQQLDKISYAFSREFGDLNAEQLNWKPDPKTWSIAQNIDHLIRVNESYFPVFSALKEPRYRIPFLGRLALVVRFFGKMILASVKPDRKRRMRTLALWEPAQSSLPADIVQRFEAHQFALKQEIEAIQPWVQKGVVISSPANKNIVYELKTALDIITSHEERHLEQAREVLALAK